MRTRVFDACRMNPMPAAIGSRIIELVLWKSPRCDTIPLPRPPYLPYVCDSRARNYTTKIWNTFGRAGVTEAIGIDLQNV